MSISMYHPTKYRQYLSYLIGLLVGLLILTVWQSPSHTLRIIACDVGQGDGILITKGSNQVIIDGGPSGAKMLECLSRHMPFWDRRIELIVLTNTDFDHMSGLSSVIDRYQVMQFVTSDGVHESAALTKFADTLSSHSVATQLVEQGDIVQILGRASIKFRVLWPPEVIGQYGAVFSSQTDPQVSKQILGASAKRGDLNERSVVLLLLEGNKKALLTGDAGFQAEKEMLSAGQLPDVDYLKVGHHGSKYASSLEFLQQIRPEVAVISSGVGNRYGHPTQEALERLAKVGANIHRTDQEGEVVWEMR